MYKKLMFLISFVCLLVLVSPVSAADLEVDWPDTYTVSGTEEYGDMDCSGTVIIPAGATLILNSESDVSGNGTDGRGGSEYAQVLVDGGTFIINDRINFGKGEDAYLIVDNGGLVINTDEKICIPDDDWGVHRLIVINGTVDATGGGIEVDDDEEDGDDDRCAGVQIACSAVPGVIIAKITTGHTDDGKWDPDKWATRDVNEGGLYDYPKGACSGAILTINDLGGNVKEVFYFVVPPEAWGPDPADGEDEIKVGVVCTWKAGDMGAPHVGDKHYLYFGTSYDDVEAAGLLDPPRCSGFKPVGMEELDPDVDCACTLVLWTNYYWRIDEKPFGGTTAKGDVWTFTTGCEIMPSDINLDCVVDGKDYAMLADDWMNVSFFPDDF